MSSNNVTIAYVATKESVECSGATNMNVINI